MRWIRGAGFPACRSRYFKIGGLESLPHWLKGLSHKTEGLQGLIFLVSFGSGF